MSLRFRLLLATAATMLLALLVVDVATYVTVTRSQLQQVDSTLERTSSPIEIVALRPREWSVIPTLAPGVLVTIVGSDGSTLYTADDMGGGTEPDSIDLTSLAADEQVQTASTVSGADIRVRLSVLDNGTVLVLGEPLEAVNETRGTLLSVLIVGSVAAIALAIALGWLLVRAGLAPLRRVEASAAAINEDQLGDERVPGANDTTELGRLALALNAMLDRLDHARVDRERSIEQLQASETRMRRFVADASHELRTPVAATAAYAELFEHGARDRPEDLERAMTGICNETKRMGELVDDLLLLARLDEQRPLAAEHVDLVEVLMESIDAARTLEPERVIRLHVRDVVSVVGDPLRLRQVVDNLLSNVRAHTPPHAICEIRLEGTDDLAVLSVADTGPGVPADGLKRLFDRFSRFDETRNRATGGNGLGLAIVEAIVAAHGGTISAAANDPHGLVVVVELPRRVTPGVTPGSGANVTEELRMHPTPK